MKQPRTKGGTFASKLTPKITNELIDWINQEMLLEEMIEKIVDKHKVHKETATRWIMKAQRVELTRRNVSHI